MGLHAKVITPARANDLRTIAEQLLSNMDTISGVSIQESFQAAAIASQNGQRIGHVYRKALFREYTDGSFTQQSPRPDVCSRSEDFAEGVVV